MKKVDVDAGDTATVVIYPYGDDVQPVELRFRAKEKKRHSELVSESY